MRCQKCHNDVTPTNGYCPMCGEEMPEALKSGGTSSYSGYSSRPSVSPNPPIRPSGGGFMRAPSDLNDRGSFGTPISPSRSHSEPVPRDLFDERTISYVDDNTPISTDPVPSSHTDILPPIGKASHSASVEVPHSAPIETPRFTSIASPARERSPLGFFFCVVTAIICTLTLCICIYMEIEKRSTASILYMIPYTAELFSDEFASSMGNAIFIFVNYIDDFDKVVKFLMIAGLIADGLNVIVLWVMCGNLRQERLDNTVCSNALKFLRVVRLITTVLIVGVTISTVFGGIKLCDKLEQSFLFSYSKKDVEQLIMVCAVLGAATILFNVLIIQLIGKLINGLQTDHYPAANPFAIIYLFASGVFGIASLHDSNFHGAEALPVLYVILTLVVVPIVFGIHLCVYNYKRTN